ncbi:MAG: hypothetical protein IT384_27840 [Deltaproteobacteria bacterium]|nr:hypothetical protein [Deltaproteobacteria bacterium]
MTTLRLDTHAPYPPMAPVTEALAAKVDALGDGNGEVTTAEVRAAPPPLQRQLFSALAYADFLKKTHDWMRVPLLPSLLSLLFGDPLRRDIVRTAEVANLVGRLPEVNEIVNPGRFAGRHVAYKTVSIGTRSPSERE